MRERPNTSLTEVLLQSLDDVHVKFVDRCAGMADGEYLWEPAAGGWTVRNPSGDTWIVDHAAPEPEPDPAPITTIAWRMWHIAVACFDGYSERAWGSTGTGLEGLDWVGRADQAIDLVDAAVSRFSEGVASVGDSGLWDQLGPGFGPWENHSLVDLVLHAQHEYGHHSGEIGLLRDLYPVR